MRLAEAIRKGATFRPQGFGEMFFVSCGGVLASCALGAAFEAATGRTTPPYWASDLFPEIDAEAAECPQCCRRGPLGFIVTHLNDEHRWTREQIADWLDRRDGIPTPAELFGGAGAAGRA